MAQAVLMAPLSVLTLYNEARWLVVAMRNAWLTPGWSRSCVMAAKMATSFSIGVRWSLSCWKKESRESNESQWSSLGQTGQLNANVHVTNKCMLAGNTCIPMLSVSIVNMYTCIYSEMLCTSLYTWLRQQNSHHCSQYNWSRIVHEKDNRKQDFFCFWLQIASHLYTFLLF